MTLEMALVFGTSVKQKHENIQARKPFSLFVDVIGKLYWRLMQKVVLFLLVNVSAIFSHGDVVASNMSFSSTLVMMTLQISTNSVRRIQTIVLFVYWTPVSCFHFPVTLLPLTIDQLDHWQSTEISIWGLRMVVAIDLIVSDTCTTMRSHADNKFIRFCFLFLMNSLHIVHVPQIPVRFMVAVWKAVY